MVARSALSVVTLLPGVPMRDSLSQGTYDYYVFSVDQSTEITLVLTPLSGDPDMYVAPYTALSPYLNAHPTLPRTHCTIAPLPCFAPPPPNICMSCLVG